MENTAKMAAFGEEMWEWAKNACQCGFDFEESEDIMEMAQRHGLVDRVEYDPKKHGEEIDCDEGDMIWYWGDKE
tara:strand:+ start:3705 stop:3926 length:222 start_codon:yes stop_codon:yes gene_type:complete